MNEKSSNKKTNPGKGKRIALWSVIVFLAVVLLALVLLWWGLSLSDEQNQETTPTVTEPAQIADGITNNITGIRDVAVTLEHGIEIINIGAYKRGSNKNIDFAMDKIDAVNSFLLQATDEKFAFEDIVAELEKMFPPPPPKEPV